MLASGPGKHDIYKSGQLLELDDLFVGLQPLMLVEIFIEDAMEKILSTLLLQREVWSLTQHGKLSQKDDQQKKAPYLDLLFHTTALIQTHTYAEVIGFTCCFTLDHCTLLPGDGLTCLQFSHLVVKFLFWHLIELTWWWYGEHLPYWITKIQLFGIPAVNAEDLFSSAKLLQ